MIDIFLYEVAINIFSEITKYFLFFSDFQNSKYFISKYTYINSGKFEDRHFSFGKYYETPYYPAS
jgi:hypothetical protein